MANAFKVILGLLVTIAIIVAGLGFIAPKDFSMSKSTVIDAPKEVVFQHVKYFEKTAAWSPWSKKDPNMESSIEGTDGSIGAIYKWSGNDEVGVGQQEITEIVENESITHHLTFLKPFASEADAKITLSDSGSNTKVTWGLSGKHGFLESVFMLYKSMDDIVGDDYRKGLASLKEIAEKSYIESRAAEVIQ